MEGGDQASDWDSDETVIEGSVTESDLEDEELPWRRLLFDQDTSLRSAYNFHPEINTTWKGTTSPEIQLAFKLREDPQKQLSANKLPLHNEDKVLQKPQDEMEQNQVLLHFFFWTRQNCSRFTESFPQAELLQTHQSMQEPGADDYPEISTYPEKELSEDMDSAEISLLSGTFLTVSDTALVKDKLLIEPEKMLTGSHTFSEPGMEVTLEMISGEEKSEDNSLETFVSALETTEEDRLLEVTNDFEPTELINRLNKSPNPIPISLTCHRDLLENTNDSALPTELLSSSLNPMSESQVDPICHREEEGNSVSAESKRLGVGSALSQTNEESTHIAEESFDTCEDQNPFELQTLVHQNVTFCDPLKNKGNSNPLDINTDQDTPVVLRRSSRLKIGRHKKHRDKRCTMPEKILPKMVGREDQTNSNSSNENSRMQNPALIIEAKGKNIHSSRLKSREQIRKRKTLAKKYEKMKLDNIPLSAINRRNVFGENLLYKAALHDDADLVLCCLKKGGNVNQQSYAGWTALHEACVGGFYRTASELIKGGADVNIKGKYQITPLHDAVVNGHYKVAELLLLNGADPLLRSDSGKCALDEAKDSPVKRLLERYVSKHRKPLRSAQKNSLDLVNVEDTHQHKKPKYSSSGFTSDESANREKPELVNLDRESKEYLLINEEDVYEHHQKGSANIRLGKSKHKELILNYTKSRSLRKDNRSYVKDSSSDLSKDKGIRNTRHKRTRMDNTIQAVSPRKTLTVSSGRIKRLIIDQQHSPQTLDDFPEESCKPDSSTVSNMKNELGNNIEIFSDTRDKYSQDLDSSNSQEVKILELKSIEQAETISFSGISSHKKIESSLVITEEPSHTHKEKQQISSCKSYKSSNLGQKDEGINKWEKSFLSFIEKKHNDEIYHCSSEETVTSKMVMSSIDHKTHCDYKENMTYRDEMDLQPHLLLEDHFSQENEFKADVLTILPQQEAVHFSDSDNTVVSQKHVVRFDQHVYGTSLDHSQNNFEHTSLAHMRTLSTHEISELTSQVELFENSQDCSLMITIPLTNQADTHIVEKVNQQEEIERNYTDKSPDPGSSSRPLSTGQDIGTMKVEQRREDLPDSEIICNINFHSTDNMNEDSTNNSQLNHRETKKASHKPDEELTNTVEDEITSSTSQNCEVEEVSRDSEIHMPTCVQEHKKIKNFSLNQNLLKDTCSQEMKTAGVSKRNATGESRLHSAARRGNVSLVKTLIESGADVNLKDNAGWTPFHEAASEGAKGVIGELLIAGADVNCENIDGIVPLHDAVSNNHLKTAKILLQHGANSNQKDEKQKATLNEIDNVTVKELLKSYGATETDNRDESNTIDTVQIPSVQSKKCKQRICDDHQTIDPPSLTRQRRTRQIHPVHQKISAILQDIEEKQENLLEFEIKTPEDAEDYIEKMSEIKEIMDSVLAKQKAERDDLAKKYRVSIESFKHGVLREQLANLATRQKKLLVAAQKQKEISLKIQNYKNVTSLSPGLTLKKQPSSSEVSGYKASQEFPSLGHSVQCQSCALSPDSLLCGSMEDDTQLSQEMRSNSQPTNPCLDAEAMRRGEISGKELNSKLNIDKHTLDGSLKRRQSDGNELLSQPLSFITQAELYSQNSSGLIETIAKGSESSSPSTVSGTLSISETTCKLTQNKAYPSTVVCDQTLFSGNPKNRNRNTVSQQPPQGASESWAHETFSVLGEEAGHQMKPYFQKSASAAPHMNDNQGCLSSASSPPRTISKPSNHSMAPRKKHVQIKDLILLGRISPGNNILEFKTQETTHKASVLLSGKIKVESGQIYQNPVTWLKDLLGGNRCVTWNYAWSKVTYLGKELLKYVSEEVPAPPEASSVTQQHQLCLPGVSRESMQIIPHYLQINEILLINDQEFLPHHIMDEHWKFYMECDELAF
ncbi:ankyrin repeat domain-containing protein 31 [Sorex fumeus]|uniref:ankyrin repeat domain-containing protein 31 n=1 Tax=Sorex fumeus TaxID=62283 RepID=UPI0024AC8A6B|nr:ankyrin repeat domain-containing protein 31 [Sorex fumeus]